MIKNHRTLGLFLGIADPEHRAMDDFRPSLILSHRT
jgi:hypothetical protein